MTPHRYEIEFQGSDDGEHWVAYPFRYKPQEPKERPGIYAPYQPRFDWNLWFASLGEWRQYPFVPRTEELLLENDAAVLRLFKDNPFPDAPPRLVRAVLWQYWFSTMEERRTEGVWWRRQVVGAYTPTIARLPDGSFGIVEESQSSRFSFALSVRAFIVGLVLFGEEIEVDGFAHGLVAGVAGVEVVAGVVEREEHAGVGGVGGDFVEVDDAVELVGGADPFVDGLAHLFAGGGLVFCADEGCEGGSVDLDAVSVGAGGELAEADDEVVGGDDVVGLGGVGGVADVVDALHDDEVLDAGLGEDVAVEAGEGGGAGGVVEDAVAADAFVEDAEVGGLLVGLEAAGEDVGPAGVGVAGAVGAVGDAVAEGDDGGSSFRRR